MMEANIRTRALLHTHTHLHTHTRAGAGALSLSSSTLSYTLTHLLPHARRAINITVGQVISCTHNRHYPSVIFKYVHQYSFLTFQKINKRADCTGFHSCSFEKGIGGNDTKGT